MERDGFNKCKVAGRSRRDTNKTVQRSFANSWCQESPRDRMQGGPLSLVSKLRASVERGCAIPGGFDDSAGSRNIYLSDNVNW